MVKRDSRKMMKKDKLKLRQLLNKSACVNNKKLKKILALILKMNRNSMMRRVYHPSNSTIIIFISDDLKF